MSLPYQQSCFHAMDHLIRCGGPDFTLRVGKPCHAESRRYAVRPCATAFTQLDVLSILIRSLPWCPLSCSQALEASSRVKNGPSSHMLLCRRRCSAVLTSVTNDEASYCIQCCRHPACAEVSAPRLRRSCRVPDLPQFDLAYSSIICTPSAPRTLLTVL